MVQQTGKSKVRPGISRRSFLQGAGVAVLSAATLGALSGCGHKEASSSESSSAFAAGAGAATTAIAQALTPAPLPANLVEPNPYLAAGEAIIHNDAYSSDVTAKAVPLGIFSEVAASEEAEGNKAVPCFFYDARGNCITPYTLSTPEGDIAGGVAVRDVNANPVRTLGRFLPALDDDEPYGIQISYAFVDGNGFLVGATTHGHVLMLRTTDEEGAVLPVFEKVLDVDVLSVAQDALGEDVDPNLLSVIMDYGGNLWFATGGFHINPEHAADGFVGYVERSFIDRAIAGAHHRTVRTGRFVHAYRLTTGEGAENGISAHPAGCVVLTNKACYLLNASDQGVSVTWRTEYQSAGGKGPREGSSLTGAGLAWGSGTTPTLSKNLVLFTDNLSPVNLIALDVNTGEVVAQHALFEDMGENVVVSVENSILVYAGDEDRVSVLACNWYGAGNAGLFAADADSSVQSCENLYDEGWIANGSAALAPGIQRVDVVRGADGYKMAPVWTRTDLCDTSMLKLSTATGYVYGYTQVDSMWSFVVLNWEDGKTAYAHAVSPDPVYNNMAVGMMQGNNGNTLYVPTNNMQLLRLQDRFAYLPNRAFERLDIDKMNRELVTAEAFQAGSDTTYAPVMLLHTATVPCAAEPTVLAVRVTGLEGAVSDFHLFYRAADGAYREWAPGEWRIVDSAGVDLAIDSKLSAGSNIYEIRVNVKAGEDYSTAPAPRTVEVSLILAR